MPPPAKYTVKQPLSRNQHRSLLRTFLGFRVGMIVECTAFDVEVGNDLVEPAREPPCALTQ